MKSGTSRRTTFVVVTCALLASLAMGALVGQLGNDAPGDGRAIATPRVVFATPVGTPGVVPPFFGLVDTVDVSTAGRPVAW